MSYDDNSISVVLCPRPYAECFVLINLFNSDDPAGRRAHPFQSCSQENAMEHLGLGHPSNLVADPRFEPSERLSRIESKPVHGANRPLS